MESELEKLEANLGGVADMKRQPDAVFVVDLKKEQLAVREARRLEHPDHRPRGHERRPGRGRPRHSRTTTTPSARARSSRACSPTASRPASSSSAPPRWRKASREEPAAERPRRGVRKPDAPSESRGGYGRARGRGRSRRRWRPDVDDDLRQPRQGAPRPDRRGDDGLQARARGDGRRPRGCSHAAPREGHRADAAKRSGRETTEGKVGFSITEESVAAMVAVGCETEPVSNNEEFLVFAQRVLERGAAPRRRRRRFARRRARRARREASARTSPSWAPRATRARSTRSSRRTSTRPRTSSACSCTRRASPTSRTRSRCTSRPRRRSTCPGTAFPEAEVDARARDPLEAGRRARQARAGAREDRRGQAREVVRGARARRPGLDPRSPTGGSATCWRRPASRSSSSSASRWQSRP